MKITDDNLICGVRPAILKKVFGCESFDTLRFMRITQIGEPAASEALRCLAELGWVSFKGNRDGVDWWSISMLADRLLATRLIKRFPVSVGRQIVERFVNEARALNREPGRSRRVTAIHLFGSVLTGSDDDTAGDIDIVVEVARRKLPVDKLKALENDELGERVKELTHFKRYGWHDNELMKRLKRLSNKISLHAMSDLEMLGVPYRQLYAFDVLKETEVPFGSAIREGQRHPSVDATDEVRLPPTKVVRPWPKPTAAEAPVTIDTESALLAEHLWVNGHSLDDIVQRVPRGENVHDYLASRAGPDSYKELVQDGDLDRVVGAFFLDDGVHAKTVEVDFSRHGSRRINVSVMVREDWSRLGGLILIDRDRGRFNALPARFILEVERIGRAAWAWSEKMRPKCVGLNVRAFTFLDPGREPKEPLGRPVMDFRPLRAPMLELLDCLWVGHRGKYDGYDLKLEVVLGSQPQVYYQRGNWGGEGFFRKKVRKAMTAPLLTLLDPMLIKWGDVLEGAHYTVSVRGEDLED